MIMRPTPSRAHLSSPALSRPNPATPMPLPVSLHCPSIRCHRRPSEWASNIKTSLPLLLGHQQRQKLHPQWPSQSPTTTTLRPPPPRLARPAGLREPRKTETATARTKEASERRRLAGAILPRSPRRKSIRAGCATSHSTGKCAECAPSGSPAAQAERLTPSCLSLPTARAR